MKRAAHEKLISGTETTLPLKNTAVLRDDLNRAWPEASVTQTILRRYATIENSGPCDENRYGTEALAGRDTGTQTNPVDTGAGQTIQ